MKWVYDGFFFLEAAGLAHGVSALFVVKDSNGTACIMANFSASFRTVYENEQGSQVGDTNPCGTREMIVP